MLSILYSNCPYDENVMLMRVVATVLILPMLMALFGIRVESPRESWVIHGIFAFLLALLVYGAYFRSKYTFIYILFFLALASVWELFEFFILGQRVEKSFILTMADTFMDMVFGIGGTAVGMFLVKLVKKHSPYLD